MPARAAPGVTRAARGGGAAAAWHSHHLLDLTDTQVHAIDSAGNRWTVFPLIKSAALAESDDAERLLNALSWKLHSESFQLDRLLCEAQLHRVGIPDDGDCFVRAVQLHLDQQQQSPQRIHALRERMCDYMDGNLRGDDVLRALLKAQLQPNDAPSVPLDEAAAAAYISRMRLLAGSGPIELHAMAQLLGRTISCFPRFPTGRGYFIPLSRRFLK